MKHAAFNNRMKSFRIRTWRGSYDFPYCKADPEPTSADPVCDVTIDPEIASEGFVYRLESGEEGTIHVHQVLAYNRDPAYVRRMLLYQLTAEAQDHLKKSRLSRREIIRRLGTSPSQFYRLLDPTNTRKSIDRMVELLMVLGCEVGFVVKESVGVEVELPVGSSQ